MTSRLDRNTLMIGVNALTKIDRDFERIVDTFGPPPLWQREEGFPTLIHIILEQQVSLASARAAFTKLKQAVRPLEPENFLSLDDDELKGIGFSRQKMSYSRALALAVAEGGLDLQDLCRHSDQEAKTRLMRIKGIGPWTADIYLLMAMGRPDIWPRGDLALDMALARLKGLSGRPSQDEMADAGNAWRPWRAVAARLLWHFYLSSPQKKDRNS